MIPIRRRLLLAAPALLLANRGARAQRADARMNERAFGDPHAKTTVQEWFSFTCTHCAHFSERVFPDIQAKLIDTGRIRYVFQDFPLDQLALQAAMVARALPPDRYLPFLETLLGSQDQWAFNRDADAQVELARQASLAGMSASDFDAVARDQRLRDAILQEQTDGQKSYDIQGTPAFIFNTSKAGPIASYAEFTAALDKATAGG